MPLRAVLAGGKLHVSYASGPGPHSVSSGAIWKYTTASGTYSTALGAFDVFRDSFE